MNMIITLLLLLFCWSDRKRNPMSAKSFKETFCNIFFRKKRLIVRSSIFSYNTISSLQIEKNWRKKDFLGFCFQSKCLFRDNTRSVKKKKSFPKARCGKIGKVKFDCNSRYLLLNFGWYRDLVSACINSMWYHSLKEIYYCFLSSQMRQKE